MAFTVTARQSGNSGQSSEAALTTSSATPTASSLFLVCSVCENDFHSTAPQVRSPSGGSLSYTEVATVGESPTIPWAGNGDFLLSGSVWRAAVGSSPSAFTVVVDHFSGGQAGFYSAVCLDVAGHDAATPVVQSAAAGDEGDEGNSVQAAVSLASAPTVGNLVVVALGAGADGGGGFAAPTMGGQAMTQVTEQDASFCQGGVWYRVVDGTETTDTVTCADVGDAVGNWTAIVVEIAAAAAGGEVTGSAAGSYTYTGTAAGTATVVGAAAGGFGYTGTATGTPTVVGQAAANITYTGAATGTPTKTGSASGSFGYTGAANGTVTVQGSAAASIAYSGAASGTVTVVGQAAAGITYSGTANGVVGGEVTGSAAGSYTYTGTAAGTVTVVGAAAMSVTFTGTASAGAIPDPNPAVVAFTEPARHAAFAESSSAAHSESSHVAYRES